MELKPSPILSDVNGIAARGIKSAAPAEPPVPAAKPVTSRVSYRLAGGIATPPVPVVSGNSGKGKPLIQQNRNSKAAIHRQIQAARRIVESSPPASPLPRIVNVKG